MQFQNWGVCVARWSFLKWKKRYDAGLDLGQRESRETYFYANKKVYLNTYK